ncbi:Rad52/Rad22 family DNA repair protein [Arcobacter porcinus]|uniref:Putative Rad52/22 family double-strand break repair protein n=1 Tax=Arcobacter porcinus TaxID=1935204 RepID=A0A5C2HDI9_9BACT|nr:Rad52/Rad22 family DNA repair protein [Arcobacter porcinus]OCL90712.1 Rad52/22 family double-strand break repair protein [Aliarcobacter thereius]QEP40867.1 putative Rad52/22 family double-strand break repair protein [Arcobacter porcinus]
MFDKKQLDILNQELDSSRIKTREKGNISLSYIEGHDVIETANKVFGFGNWSYSISKLEHVSQEQNQNQNQVICYKAIVQVLVHSENHTLDVSREDVGFGTGVAKTQADAHEGAAKEAVTDALKRAMRSFGNQFGNSLYDKTKNHQANNESIPSKPQQTNYRQSSPTATNVTTNHNRNIKQSYDPYEYESLFRIGLDVVEQNGFLIVTGDDIFAKKDSIKACGFRWDGKTKSWYKQIEQGAA